MKIALLASGTGSNVQAILDAAKSGQLGPAIPTVLIANVPGAKAIDRAKAAGIETLCIDHRNFSTRESFDDALVAALKTRAIDLVVLAGFMRILSARFFAEFAGRTVNIHPSLLPAFPGTHSQKQAIEHGVKIAGCTVHFVEEGVDTGPIIAQASVSVRDDDDSETLAARILEVEHQIYPRTIRAIAEGRVTRRGRTASVSGERI